MSNEKLNACYELHTLCNHFALIIHDPYYTLQLELLGMQGNSAELLRAISQFHDVVQLNTEMLTSEVH
jgi:hypothetical protein